MAILGPEHFRMSLVQAPLRVRRRMRGGWQAGKQLIDGLPKAQPETLTVTYNGPRVLTIRASSVPEETIISGKSSAILIETNPFLRSRGQSKDVTWFKGRFEGLRWNRNPSRDELVYSFIGQRDELDFWGENDSGGSKLGFGGETNETIRAAMVRLFSLHELQLGHVLFESTSNFLTSLPRTSLPALLIDNKKFSTIIDLILRSSPTLRWLVRYGEAKLDSVIFHDLRTIATTEITTVSGQISDIDIDISSRGLASAVRMTGNIDKFAPPVHSVLTPDWNVNNEKLWTIRDFQSFLELQGGGGSATEPPVNLTEEGIAESVSFGNIFRRWKVTDLVWFKQFDRAQPVRLLQKVLLKKRGNTQEEFGWISLKIKSIDWDTGVILSVWPVTKPIIGVDARDTSRWTDDSNTSGKAKKPEAGEVILGGHISASTIPSLRVPATGWAGTAFNVFGITREARVTGLEASKFTQGEGALRLALVSEPRIIGRVTLRGLRTEFINLGKRIVIRSPANSLGLDNFRFNVVRVVYSFVENSTALELSTEMINPNSVF